MPDINNDILQHSYEGMNCIWGASGIINFCSCDNNFNCDECALDKILKNLFTEEGQVKSKYYDISDTEFIDKIIIKIKNLRYDEKLIYLKNNMVLKHIFSNIYYLGFNPVFVSLLDNITSIKEYMKRIYFVKGTTLMNIEGEWGSYTVKAPVNFLLLDKISHSHEEIISDNRIALVLLNQEEISEGKLSCIVWNNERLKILKLLDEYKSCCLKINTLPSFREEKINSFYKLIGKSEYIKLLNLQDNE